MIEVLGIVFVYSFNRRRFWIPVLFSGMLFVVLYDLREQVNLSDIRNGYYDHYANISVSEQRDWFGIGYYPDILDRVSQYIKPAFSGQKVYLATQQGFPLFGYAQYRFHPTKTILVEEGKEMELAQK